MTFKINYELLPFQMEGSAFLAHTTAALLADEPGLGKTPQAVDAAINYLRAERTLVIAPANAKAVWVREIAKWADRPMVIQTIDTSEDEILPVAEVVIVNPDLVTYGATYKPGYPPVLDQWGPVFDKIMAESWDVGIVDEAHMLRSRESLRSRALLVKNRIMSRCGRKWFLSGTPVMKRPRDLYPLLRACRPDILGEYADYTKFAYRYCAAYMEDNILHDDGASHTDELGARLKSSGFMLRRTKEEVLPDLPPVRFQVVPLEPTPTEMGLIGREIVWHKNDFSKPRLNLGGEFLATHRRELGLAKINQCVEYITEEMEKYDKLLVFAYHREVLERLWVGLKQFHPLMLMGGVSKKNRGKIEDEFQNDPTRRIFIGQTTAAGESITLTAASTVIFVEPSWLPSEIKQATKRADRYGQTAKVLAKFLVVEGSLDEYMLRSVVDSMEVIQELLQ